VTPSPLPPLAELLDEVAVPPPLGSRTGEGITPVLCNGDDWGPLQGGLDQVEVAVQLTPEGRRFVEAHLVLKPARYGRSLCGTERNGVWSKFMGVTTLYDPRHGTIAYDFHPHERDAFAPLGSWMEIVSGELNRRVELGVAFEGWPIVKRADVGVDIGFRDPELGRAFYEALRDRRYAKGRRVQERQPGWFSVLGRGTRQPVQHARVYDKGAEAKKADPWLWIRTERVVRWERRDGMRLSLLTAGALRHAYDEVFLEGLGREAMVLRRGGLATMLTTAVREGRVTVRQYEELAGYLLAERVGLARAVYGVRPAQMSRRERLSRELGIPRDGVRATSNRAIDVSQVLGTSRKALDADGTQSSAA